MDRVPENRFSLYLLQNARALRLRTRLGATVAATACGVLILSTVPGASLAKPQYECLTFQPPASLFDTPAGPPCSKLAGTSPFTPDGNTLPWLDGARAFPTGDAAWLIANSVSNTDPISADGEFVHAVVDITLPGPGLPYSFKRTYRSRIHYRGALGSSWDHTFNQRLIGKRTGEPTCDGQIDYHNGELGTVHFVQVPSTSNPAVFRTNQPVALELQRWPLTTTSGWTLIDRAGGIASTFNHSGYLQAIEDAFGNSISVTWTEPPTGSSGIAEPHRINYVTDTVGRVIYYNYDANGLLKCISHQAVNTHQACVAPLVSFDITRDPTKNDFAELLSVTLADDTAPTEKYNYNNFANPNAELVPESFLKPYCSSLCNTANGSDGKPLCSNANVCETGPTNCRYLADRSDPCVKPLPGDPDYDNKLIRWHRCEQANQSRLLDKCVNFCMWDGRTGCADPNNESGWNWCADQTCTPACEGGGVPYGGYPSYFVWQAETCQMNFQSDFTFCANPSTCEDGCVEHMRTKFQPNGKPGYIFGTEADLSGNLLDIRNGRDELIVSNTYGGDPETVDYDRVIWQAWGDKGDSLSLRYHDLNLEQSPPAFAQKAPSTPDPQHVQSLAAFMSVSICDGCALGATTCGAARDDTGSDPSQRPTHAVVQTDIYGRNWVRYYDSKDGWNLLREVNFSTNETVDYNYAGGRSSGVRTANGSRICLQRDDRGLVLQTDKLPAPGLPGDAQPVQERFEYAAAFPFLLRHVLDVASGASETFDPYFGWRVAATHRTVNAAVDPSRMLTWSTRLTRDSYYPHAQVNPDLSETQFSDYSDAAAAPKTVVVDALGPSPITTKYDYDSAGNLISAGQPHRALANFTYDRVGRRDTRWRRMDDNSPWVQDHVRWLGQHPYVAFDADKQLYENIDSAGQVFHELAIPTQLTDENSYEVQNTCYHRKPDGRLLDVIKPEGNFLHYEYDDNGRVVRVDAGDPGPLPDDWTKSWAQACRSNARTILSRNVETIASYEYSPGGVLRASTQGGIRTAYVTDGFGRVIESVDAIGRRTLIGYDGRSRVTWRASFEASAPHYEYGKPYTVPGLVQLVEFEYDDLNRVLKKSLAILREGGTVDTVYSYDDAHNAVTVTRGERSVTTRRDGAGRVVETTLADGSKITNDYTDGTRTITTTQTNHGPYVEQVVFDGLGLPGAVIKAGDTVTHEVHDIDGRVLTTTQVGGLRQDFTYDWLGRLLNSQARGDGDPKVQEVQQRFDRNNRRISLSDRDGNTTSFAFDGIDRLFQRTDPFERVHSTRYYPGTTLPSSIEEPSRHTRVLSYDPAGQLIEEVTKTPGVPMDVDRQFTYTGLGQLETATIVGAGVDNTTTRAYDPQGRIKLENNSLWPFDVRTWTERYDTSTWTMANGEEWCLSFDRLGRAVDIGWLGVTTLKTWDYGLMGSGPALSSIGPGGMVEEYSFDARGRQIGTDVKRVTGDVIASFHESFGVDGNVRARQRRIGTGSLLSDLFEFDSFGRLIAEAGGVEGVPELSPSGVENVAVDSYLQRSVSRRTYTLSAEDDVTQVQRATGSATRKYNAIHQFSTADDFSTPTYDGDDNTVAVSTGIGTETYGYDSLGQLTSAKRDGSGVDFIYDALGRRVAEVQNGEMQFFMWLGHSVVAHGSPTNGYDFEAPGRFLDDHVASWHMERPIEHGFWYVNAPDGSVWALTDGHEVVETYNYSAFGETSVLDANGQPASDSAYGNRFRYQGQLYDRATQTYSMRAREYHPRLGRFLSTDPIGLSGGMNLYGFAAANPVMNSDPFGLDPSAAMELYHQSLHSDGTDTNLQWVPGTTLQPGSSSYVPVVPGSADGGFTDSWNGYYEPPHWLMGPLSQADTEFIVRVNAQWFASRHEPASVRAVSGEEVDTIHQRRSDPYPERPTSFYHRPTTAQIWGGAIAKAGNTLSVPLVAATALPGAALENPLENPLISGAESEFNLTQTVAKHAAERPYVNSPLTIREIMETGPGVPDPQGVPGALRWDVPGSFNGSNGTYELVYDPATNTVLHFKYGSGR